MYRVTGSPRIESTVDEVSYRHYRQTGTNKFRISATYAYNDYYNTRSIFFCASIFFVEKFTVQVTAKELGIFFQTGKTILNVLNRNIPFQLVFSQKKKKIKPLLLRKTVVLPDRFSIETKLTNIIYRFLLWRRYNSFPEILAISNIRMSDLKSAKSGSTRVQTLLSSKMTRERTQKTH